jgi:hypothetical protein
MIPHVFVSSTIADLQHVRDALRDRIERVGYSPVLSDHNGVGYVPRLSAIDSCLNTVPLCSIAVIIIGKRYGSIVDDGSGLSVTHQEYRTARNAGLPMFCLVDKEVLAFDRVFTQNTGLAGVRFPAEMDNPRGTFGFLNEVRSHETNNGILAFENVTDACDVLTTQLAHFFGDLLAKHHEPRADQFREVLAEIAQLREDVLRGSRQPGSAPSPDPAQFVQATELMASGTYQQLRSFLVPLSGGIVEAVTDLLSHDTLDAYFASKTISPTITDEDSLLEMPNTSEREAFMRVRACAWFMVPENVARETPQQRGQPGPMAVARFRISRDNAVSMNQAAHRYLAFCYSSVRAMSRISAGTGDVQPESASLDQPH